MFGLNIVFYYNVVSLTNTFLHIKLAAVGSSLKLVFKRLRRFNKASLRSGKERKVECSSDQRNVE